MYGASLELFRLLNHIGAGAAIPRVRLDEWVGGSTRFILLSRARPLRVTE